MAQIGNTYFVYIITNSGNHVLYVGVTSDLVGRCYKHIHKEYENSFSARYNLNKLVYYERFESIDAAIAREKQLKAGSRQKKLDLIHTWNPNWLDLYETELSKW